MCVYDTRVLYTHTYRHSRLTNSEAFEAKGVTKNVTHTHTHTHMNMHTYTHTIHEYAQTHTREHTHTRKHTHTQLANSEVFEAKGVTINTAHTHTYTHTHNAHTCTHTHIYKQEHYQTIQRH